MSGNGGSRSLIGSLSGGNSGGNSATNVPPEALQQMIPTQRQFAQGFPGQLDALSQQMASGFGGQPSDFMQSLDGLYDPFSVLQFPAPISSLQASYKSAGKNAKPTVNTGNATLDNLIKGKK